MYVYIFCDNNLYHHVKQWLDGKDFWVRVEEVNVQTPFWTCCGGDIIIMTYWSSSNLNIFSILDSWALSQMWLWLQMG
jgi:hypothetical protein